MTSTGSGSRRLTLKRLMVAVAASAAAFAILPAILAAGLAAAICGVMVVDGLRLPILTDGGEVRGWLPWAVWLVILACCPIAACVVAEVNPHVGPPNFSGPLPPATWVVNRLGLAHLAISVIAAIAVVVLARGGLRWVAWATILLIGLMAELAFLGAAMATSGIYL